ncbi:signal recognition particle-docking protein FtsY [Neptunomonas phycophila]|uniref:signal recognition particle-docking protein FtsY n=1 Tax=Neptunomonas phycophila TaxID=1572645 RepID=UPI0015BA44B4|nr:signal recognition particle-docking protein FtsY [Neptunomonas phycophila]QLE97846.1 signal recognition particle-docking protein FtsY [Neptunomonas phycophila]
MFKKLKSIFSSNEDKQDVNESDVQQGEVVSVETADKLPEDKVDEASQSSEQVNDTIPDTLSEESTEVVHDAAAAINDELPVSAKEPVSAPQDMQAESAQEPEVTEVQTEPEADKAPEPVVIDTPAATPAVVTDEAPQKKGMFARIKAGLSRTKANLTEQLGTLFLGKKEIDDELLEDIETLLLTSDVGVEATTDIIDRLTSRVQRNQLADAQALHQALKDELAGLLGDVEQPLVAQAENAPYVILMVGVNGVGKTTTIGKLTKRFQSEGKSVMLAAGDTFRAAAVEQLQVWGERNNVPVIAQHTGADSASVLFDAVQSAKAKSIDVLIADTAGRLQNKDHLMEELEKVVRVMRKIDPAAPHEVMLVLDAGTGQNAMSQAKIFQEAVGVTGITLTKLDGTAKGGIIFAIAKQLKLPIRFIGVGEQVDDLRPFKADEFVEALFDE